MVKRLPKLCLHKPSRQWYIRIAGGRPIYLGTDEAAAEQRRLRILDEFRQTGIVPNRAIVGGPTVAVLVAAYLHHAEQRYVRADGSPTSEISCIRLAMRPLLRCYGHTHAAQFGPLDLEALLRRMADGSWRSAEEIAALRARGRHVADGWCRRVANRMAGRLRRVFSWGVKYKFVPATVRDDLASAEPLRANRGCGRETVAVPPAPLAAIAAARMLAPGQVRDMIDLQLLTGARPGEICALRPCDIDRTGELLARLLGVTVPLGSIWAYLPGLDHADGGGLDQPGHKTAHHGHRRIVPLGPRAQELLLPYLSGRPPARPLFAPAELREQRYLEMRARRRSPVQPSQQCRRLAAPRKAPGLSWSTASYSKAVAALCRRAAATGIAGAEHFHVHQLRHNAATSLEREFGAEVARIVCGHRSLQTTQIYIAEDLQRAFQAIAQVG